MAKYHFTNKAIEDLSAIWNYTFDAWLERQADLYYAALISSCGDLAQNPNIGRNYEEIAENLYGYRANRHVIFYRVISDDEIEIVRILHGNMDLKNRIRE